MKPVKRFNKLVLNKESLRSLSAQKLGDVQGGGSISARCIASWCCSSETLAKCEECATSDGPVCNATYTCY
jgi:hypothetical protein